MRILSRGSSCGCGFNSLNRLRKRVRICGAQATAAAAVMEMLHQIVKLAPEMKSFWEPIQAETMFAATTTKPNEKDL